MRFLAKSDQIRAVTIRELTRNVAEIFDRVEKGEPVLLIRRGRPIATIQPLEQFVVRRALEKRSKTGTNSDGAAGAGEPDATTDPPPDLTEAQWTALESVADKEHPDDVARSVGDVRISMAAMGWLEARGFIKWTRRGYRPTLIGLQALDARDDALS